MADSMRSWAVERPGPGGPPPRRAGHPAGPASGPRRDPGARRRVRPVPHRSAPRRGRPRAPAAGSGARSPGRGPGRRARSRRPPVRTRRPGRHRLAPQHLWRVPVVPDRCGEPLPGLALHRVGRGRGLRRVRRGTGRLRLRAARLDRRRAGRSAAVRRHHRLPGAAPRPAAAGRPAGHRRLRFERPHHRPDRGRAGSRGARDDPRRGRPGACPGPGCRVGRWSSGPSARAPGLRDRVRALPATWFRSRCAPSIAAGPWRSPGST